MERSLNTCSSKWAQISLSREPLIIARGKMMCSLLKNKKFKLFLEKVVK